MNKTALALGVVGILTYSVPTMPVKGISDVNNQAESESPEDLMRTAGLIKSYYARITSGTNIIYINASINTNSTMQTLGYTDITVEYSSDGSNWYQEKYVGNLLISESSTYYLNNFAVTVKGGYYRIRLNHYAEESGLFGSSQTIANISNTVWID